MRTVIPILALLAAHAAPGALVHRWSFDDGPGDSVGSADAILVGGATTGGGSLQLNGSTAFATLPIDSTLASLGSMTIEAWATYDQLSAWARVFDFGNGDRNSFPTQGYLFLTGSPQFASIQSFAQFSITTTTNANSENVYAGAIPGPTVPLHYAVTIDATNNVGSVYIDGNLQLSGTINLTPQDVVSVDGLEHNWLGRSRFNSDSYLDGSIDEFRIHDNALTDEEVLASFQLGPDVIPEPASGVLVLLGAAALCVRRARPSGPGRS